MRYLILAGLVVSTTAASADVVDKSAAGFTSKTSVTINASPQRVYDAFLRVGEWWDPAHTWSGGAQTLRIEPRSDGCFCETLANGGSVRHASVVFVDPGKLVRMNGALGPLQSMAVTGSLTWTFERPEPARTRRSRTRSPATRPVAWKGWPPRLTPSSAASCVV